MVRFACWAPLWRPRFRGGLFSLCTALALGVLALLPATAGAAATITVCASGGDYTTIQAAVSAAAPGDTVSVSAGSYNEDVTIATPLTLSGAGAATTTIS